MMTALPCVLLLLMLLTGTQAHAQSDRILAQPRLPTVELSAGMYRIEAEVADTRDRRRIGLMGRTEMAPHEGMLFVFDEPGHHCMWMRNTLLPLSVAFLDEEGTILNIARMAPQSDQHHCAVGDARYALEMNHGWFGERGIGAGQRILGKRVQGARASVE